MIAGVSGMLTLLLAGVALMAARRAAELSREPAEDLEGPPVRVRPAVPPWRVTAGLLGLLVTATFCGHQLQTIHDSCLSLRFTSYHPVIVIRGNQFNQLIVLHAVLTLAVGLTALSLMGRLVNSGGTSWKPTPQKLDRLAGLAGLLGVIAAGLAIHSTYPASIYDATVRGYFILLLLITVPVAVFLLVASLFLLLRRKTPLGTDADPAFPLCPSCGYNLTGNTSGRCPECSACVPPSIASLLAREPLQRGPQARSSWPRSIAWACFAFAFSWTILTIIRLIEPLGRVICSVLPCYEVSDLVISSHSHYPVHQFPPLGLSFAWAGVLFTGALGLRQHRRWGAWVCLGWVIVSIPLVILDAAILASGYIHGVSPGFHSNVVGLRLAFVRTVIGAAFPIFLGLWLLQRHVRWRIATWLN